MLILFFISFSPQIVSELKDTIRNCKLLFKAPYDVSSGLLEDGSVIVDESTGGSETLDFDACVLTTKAIDKILIRYNRVPIKFTAPFEEYCLTSQSNFTIGNPAGVGGCGSDLNHQQSQLEPQTLEIVDEANSYRDLQVFAKVNLAAQAVHAAADTLAILSRYFHHQRWIWLTSQPFFTGQLVDVPIGDCETFIHSQLVPVVTALTK